MAIVLSGSVTASAIPNPYVTSVDPANGAVNVPVNTVINVTFNKPIQSGSSYEDITVKNGAGTEKVISKSITDKVLTITTKPNYNFGDTYTLYIPVNAVTDSYDNGLATEYTSTFTAQKCLI